MRNVRTRGRAYFTHCHPAGAFRGFGVPQGAIAHEALMDETMALAGQLASGPTLAYGRMKENLNRGESSDLAALLDQEALNMQLSSMTQDHREAAKSFVEKRKPTFSGA